MTTQKRSGFLVVLKKDWPVPSEHDGEPCLGPPNPQARVEGSRLRTGEATGPLTALGPVLFFENREDAEAHVAADSARAAMEIVPASIEWDRTEKGT